VLLVKLEEGPVMVGGGTRPPDQLSAGMPVEARFERRSPNTGLVHFAPADRAAQPSKNENNRGERDHAEEAPR
jgi:uncharacterized OB-fold protein